MFCISKKNHINTFCFTSNLGSKSKITLLVIAFVGLLGSCLLLYSLVGGQNPLGSRWAWVEAAGGGLLLSIAVGGGIYVIDSGKKQKVSSHPKIQKERPRPHKSKHLSLTQREIIQVDTNQELDTAYNFLQRPGSHTKLSPVVGTRALELEKVQSALRRDPILHDLEKAIYQSEFIYLIPLDKKDAADKFSKKTFLAYISKYSSTGITEDNIVQWMWDEKQKDSPCINKTFTNDTVNEWNTWHAKVYVMGRSGKANEKYERYLPPHIVAYHEVMHVEELRKLAKKKSQSPGVELLTATKTLILLDEVYKDVHNLSKNEVVDYGKSINLRGRLIPLGEFVNFYRKLERTHRSLAEALISPESLTYLHGGNRPVLKDKSGRSKSFQREDSYDGQIRMEDTIMQ